MREIIAPRIAIFQCGQAGLLGKPGPTDDLPFQRLAAECSGIHCENNVSAVDRMNNAGSAVSRAFTKRNTSYSQKQKPIE